MKKLLLIFTLLSLLTACGGKEEFGNALIDTVPGLSDEERAVWRIANYVKYNDGKVPPLSLFTQAGIINVDEINKESILKLISQKDFDTVNSKSELQTLIDKYNIAIKKVKAFAEDKGEAPTVEDYFDIGVSDKELQTKLETLNTQIKGLPKSELEKLSLIKILSILEKF